MQYIRYHYSTMCRLLTDPAAFFPQIPKKHFKTDFCAFLHLHI